MVYRNRLVLDLDEQQSPELAREHNVQLRLLDDYGCHLNKDSSLGQLHPVSVLLYEWGLLSFNPLETIQLTDAEHAEVSFLSALAKTGCSKNDIKRFLKNLRKPYAYHLARLHYDWAKNRWLFLRYENADEVFKEMLEDCIRDGNGLTLKLMKYDIEEAESRYIAQWGSLDD